MSQLPTLPVLSPAPLPKARTLARPSAGTNGGARVRWVYTVKLLLDDPTAQLDVLLFGPDAATFFGGELPACDMAAEPAVAGEVEDRLQRLVGKGYQRWAGGSRWGGAGRGGAGQCNAGLGRGRRWGQAGFPSDCKGMGLHALRRCRRPARAVLFIALRCTYADCPFPASVLQWAVGGALPQGLLLRR